MYLLPGNLKSRCILPKLNLVLKITPGNGASADGFGAHTNWTNAGEKSLPPVSKNAKDKFEPEREIILTQTVDKQPMTCLENICHVYGSRKEADASKKTEEGVFEF